MAKLLSRRTRCALSFAPSYLTMEGDTESLTFCCLTLVNQIRLQPHTPHSARQLHFAVALLVGHLVSVPGSFVYRPRVPPSLLCTTANGLAPTIRQVHGAIYVVDASDSSRFPESKAELDKVAEHPMVVGKPLLVYVSAWLSLTRYIVVVAFDVGKPSIAGVCVCACVCVCV